MGTGVYTGDPQQHGQARALTVNRTQHPFRTDDTRQRPTGDADLLPELLADEDAHDGHHRLPNKRRVKHGHVTDAGRKGVLGPVAMKGGGQSRQWWSISSVTSLPFSQYTRFPLAGKAGSDPAKPRQPTHRDDVGKHFLVLAVKVAPPETVAVRHHRHPFPQPHLTTGGNLHIGKEKADEREQSEVSSTMA